MSAFLFSAATTRVWVQACADCQGRKAEMVQTRDDCSNWIVYGGDFPAAEKTFRSTITPPEGTVLQFAIRKLAAAPFFDHALLESGQTPIDWPMVSLQAESETMDERRADLDPGYWADVNQFIFPKTDTISVELLQKGLPADMVAGLNWAAEHQFYFVLTVLRDPASGSEDSSGEREPEFDADGLLVETVEDKEAAMLIRARNSVVAAWIWRIFSAKTSLAGHRIRIDPWCVAISLNP